MPPVLVRLVLVVVCLLAACSQPQPPSATCTAKGTSACGANCVTLATDDANCGSCGHACSSGERCGNGACLPAACGATVCGADQACSANACVDKACAGVVCGFGETCAKGDCVCDEKHTLCGGHCIDPKTDDANCGACGHACAAAEGCGAGQCLASDCPQTSCDPASVCFNSSCTNKACVGVVCPSGQSCSAGACGCASTETDCGGRCANLKTDSSNCGTCGNLCPAGQRCGAGQCLAADCAGVTCGPTAVCVQSACVEASCVGVACSGGSACAGGVCACPQGQVQCTGGCADLGSSDQNCGTCGNRCTTGQQCLNGTCGVTGCPSGKRVCGGSCVDLQADPDNCSACGNACGGGRVCVGGACQCPAGLSYCNAACVNLVTDGQNCGGCGRSCNGGTCNGVCACPGGQSLCGDTCRNTQSDALACGGCNRPCATGQTCQAGMCVCGAGYSLCGGSCIPTSADNANCGGCNLVCAASTSCSSSACHPDITCQGSFNTAPADCPLIPVDASRCGVLTPIGTQTPFSGGSGNNMIQMIQMFTVTQANERMEMRGNWTPGSSGCGTHYFMLQSSAGTPIATQPQVNQGGTAPVNVIAPGSVYACAHAAQASVQPSGCNSMAFAVNLQRYGYSGKYNTGGNSAANADTFSVNATSTRVCDQVCGNLMNVCGDTREFYRLALPPMKAAVVEVVFQSQAATSTFNLQAMDLGGGFICNLLQNGMATQTPTTFRARVVNNTNQTQVIHLVPNTLTNDLGWNLAVAVEP